MCAPSLLSNRFHADLMAETGKLFHRLRIYPQHPNTNALCLKIHVFFMFLLHLCCFCFSATSVIRIPDDELGTFSVVLKRESVLPKEAGVMKQVKDTRRSSPQSPESRGGKHKTLGDVGCQQKSYCHIWRPHARVTCVTATRGGILAGRPLCRSPEQQTWGGMATPEGATPVTDLRAMGEARGSLLSVRLKQVWSLLTVFFYRFCTGDFPSGLPSHGMFNGSPVSFLILANGRGNEIDATFIGWWEEIFRSGIINLKEDQNKPEYSGMIGMIGSLSQFDLNFQRHNKRQGKVAVYGAVAPIFLSCQICT